MRALIMCGTYERKEIWFLRIEKIDTYDTAI